MKRPLVAATLSFILSCTLSILTDSSISRFFFTVCACLLAAFLLFRLIFKRHSLSFISLLLAFMVAGFGLCSFIHIPSMKRAKSYDGFSGEIVAQITHLEKAEYYSKLTVETLTIGEDKARVKIAYVSSVTDDLKEGDVVRIGGRIHTRFQNSLSYNSERSYSADGIFLLLDEKYTEKTDLEPNYFRRAIFELRESCIRSSRSLDNAGLICALTVGDKSSLDPETNATFQKLGLSHALAVSGMHLSILIMSFYMFLKKRSAGKYFSSILCSVLVVIYMVLTGLSFSIIRAGIMMIIYFLSMLVRRQNDSVTTLFTSALLIVAQNPWSVFDIGFQLSFFATLGILTFCPNIMDKMENVKLFSRKNKDGFVTGLVKKYLRKAFLSATLVFVTSLSATLSTLPLTLLYFKSFNAFSIIANICVLFLINFLLVLSMIHLLVSISFLSFLSPVTEALCNLLSNTVVSFTHLLADTFPEPLRFSPEASRVIAYTSAVILLVFFIFFKKRRVLFLLVIIVAFSSCITYVLYSFITKDNAYITLSCAKSCRAVLIEENGYTTLVVFPSDRRSAYRVLDILDCRNVYTIDKAVFITESEIQLDKISSVCSRCKISSLFFATPDGVLYESDRAALEKLTKGDTRLECIPIGSVKLSPLADLVYYPEDYTQVSVRNKNRNITVLHSFENGAFAPSDTYRDFDGVIFFGESDYYPHLSPKSFYMCDIAPESYIQGSFDNVNLYNYCFVKLTPDTLEYTTYPSGG